MSYGLDPNQFARLIVRPTLVAIGLWSPAAGALVLGTGMQESRLRFIKQVRGPALGLFQMEPETFIDLRENFLAYNSPLRVAVSELANPSLRAADPGEMIGNLILATAMCRVHYRRVREELPDAADALGMAAYWKRYYNTASGKGTAQQALPHFQRAIEIISEATSQGEVDK